MHIYMCVFFFPRQLSLSSLNTDIFQMSATTNKETLIHLISIPF